MGKQITFTFYFLTPSNSVFRDVSGHSGVPGCSGCSGVLRCSGVAVLRCCGVAVFRCSVVFRGVPGCSGVPVFRCSGVPWCSAVPGFSTCREEQTDLTVCSRGRVERCWKVRLASDSRSATYVLFFSC